MTPNRKKMVPTTIAALALVAAACGGGTSEAGDDQDGDDPAASTVTEAPVTSTTTAAPATTETTVAETAPDEPAGNTISFETAGWPEITNGAHYEGWLIVDDAPVSTGRFNVVDGTIVDLDGDAVDSFEIDADTADATAVVITIEPVDDADPAPADTHFLAGDVVDGTAALTIAHPAALGTDFADAIGEFVLATPTDGDTTNNEFSGVWFLKFPGPEAGLDLPELPAGWTYEGWTVIDGVPLTTGTFLSPVGSDDAAPFSGTVRTPGFPGEDYLANPPAGLDFPLDVRGSGVVVSVEPLTENDPLPFALKPLVGEIPPDAEVEPTSYPVTNGAFEAPTGVATFA